MGQPTTLPEPWAAISLELGGVIALAEALDVTRRTVHRWAHEERTPDELRQRDVRERLRSRGIFVTWRDGRLVRKKVA